MQSRHALCILQYHFAICELVRYLPLQLYFHTLIHLNSEWTTDNPGLHIIIGILAFANCITSATSVTSLVRSINKSSPNMLSIQSLIYYKDFAFAGEEVHNFHSSTVVPAVEENENCVLHPNVLKNLQSKTPVNDYLCTKLCNLRRSWLSDRFIATSLATHVKSVYLFTTIVAFGICKLYHTIFVGVDDKIASELLTCAS